MVEANEKRDWLDFNEIKKSADVRQVLGAFGVLDGLTEQGDELVGWCPIGTKQHGKKDSFHFNTEKKTFQCFACKNRGSVLDFVARFESITLRRAGTRVNEIMENGEDTPEDTDEAETLFQKSKESVAGVKVFGYLEALNLVDAEELNPAELVVLLVPRKK